MEHTQHAAPAFLPSIQLHSIADVCNLTTLRRNAVYRLVKDGRLERVKIGRRMMIPDDALRAFIAKHRA